MLNFLNGNQTDFVQKKRWGGILTVPFMQKYREELFHFSRVAFRNPAHGAMVSHHSHCGPDLLPLNTSPKSSKKQLSVGPSQKACCDFFFFPPSLANESKERTLDFLPWVSPKVIRWVTDPKGQGQVEKWFGDITEQQWTKHVPQCP